MLKKFIQPCFDRILVKKLDAVTEISGFIVPDQSVEAPSEGYIVALGPDILVENVYNTNNKVGDNVIPDGQKFALGDHVIFGKFAGKPVKVDDDEFLLLNSKEIDAIVVAHEVADAEIVGD